MIRAIFGGMPIVLLAASLYWALRRRPGQRPAGTLSLSALLACFAVSFSAYQPAIRAIEDSITPDFSRLISNSATLSAAASVSSVLLYLNHDTSEARRRLRWRLRLLALAVATMAIAFAITPRAVMWSAAELQGKLDEAPASLHVYSVAYVAYLGYAVYDCLTQTWTRSRTATRTSQRIGLRTTAVGCVFALVYTAHKTINAVAALLGWTAIPDGRRCTSLFTPVDCAFSVTAPAIGVLLITAGLTVPAALWPLTQFLRRRWERQSIADLKPLWQDFTAALPEIVLETDATTNDEADFLLHRRVVEINDGILTLRPYRSLAVQQAAASEIEGRNLAHTTHGDAVIEAAVLASAIQAMRAGAEPEAEQAPQAPGTAARAGDLRAETIWLRSVARAYAASDVVRTASREATMLETV
ncbi:MAB_1171c family putative transporter [Streptomyces sp. NPDC127040]|uniref:MAB_1171c family putative transporter n=1 Tax=Streptomyces sp. NPDC127040 TaxID=3347116 RepID=UPI0036572482